MSQASLLLHDEVSLGWHDWPWFAGFAVFCVAFWFLLQWLKRRGKA